MSGFFDGLRQKVTSSVWKEDARESASSEIDDKIALGVLLWVVAEADEKFLPEEKEKIEQILKDYSGIEASHLPVVLHSIEEAARERIDLYKFTSEVRQDLPYPVKVSIVENLFRVACADGELANMEVETIRKISGLLRVDHKEFIEAKLKVKEEFHISQD